MKSCALTNTPLSKPVGICRLGLLYNKFHFLQILMNNSVPAKFKHLKKMGDVKEVTITFNPTAKFPLYCPLTSKPINGANSFICLWECGCLLYEKMAFSLSGVPYCMEKIEEIKRTEGPRAKTLKKKFKCPNCGAKFTLRKVVALNLSVGDIEGQLRSKQANESYWRRKKEKQKRKEKTETKRTMRALDVEMISLGYKPSDARRMGLTRLGGKAEDRSIPELNPAIMEMQRAEGGEPIRQGVQPIISQNNKMPAHLEKFEINIAKIERKKRKRKSEKGQKEKSRFEKALEKARRINKISQEFEFPERSQKAKNKKILTKNKTFESDYSKTEKELKIVKLGKRGGFEEKSQKDLESQKKIEKDQKCEKTIKNEKGAKSVEKEGPQSQNPPNPPQSEFKSGQSMENHNDDRIETENENDGNPDTEDVPKGQE